MSNEVDRRVDFFGSPIDIGDFVVVANAHSMACCKITKKTPKMVRTVNVLAKTAKAKQGVLRYAHELVKIDPQLASFYVIRSS